MRKQGKAGFTMAELLIVVAVIAVLVAIAIPVFSAQLEKSRRAVDLSNSRDVYAALSAGYLTGEISFPSANGANGGPACVVVLSDKDEVKYFASGNVIIDGKNWEGDHGIPYNRVREYLESCGISVGTQSSFKVHSTQPGEDGWDSWAVILCSDGTRRVMSYINGDNNFSTGGSALEEWCARQLRQPETNIEKASGGQS